VEQRFVDAAKAALEQAGFPFVRKDVPVSTTGRSRFRADLVAWSGDPTGQLRPYAAVEILAPQAGPSAVEAALESLTLVRDLLGTSVHYVVTGTTWLQADSGLREARRVAGPHKPPAAHHLQLADPDVTTKLLDERIRELTHQQKDRTGADAAMDALAVLLDELGQHPRSLQVGNQTADIPEDVLWPALRNAARHTLARGHYFGEHTSVPAIADPMAALLGPLRDGIAVDPFCGVGSTLWAVGARAQIHRRQISLRGYELNQTVAELARRLGALSPNPPAIEVRDSLQVQREEADFVVAEPPIGLRFRKPYYLDGVGETRDGDLAVLDACLRFLRPAGRAVIHVSNGWTFRGGTAQRFRDRLLDTCRVTALIGLPAGTFTGTSIPSVLVVLDKAAPTDTFIAQLGEDWAQQLSPGGAALADYLTHVGSASEPGLQPGSLCLTPRRCGRRPPAAYACSGTWSHSSRSTDQHHQSRPSSPPQRSILGPERSPERVAASWDPSGGCTRTLETAFNLATYLFPSVGSVMSS